MKNIFRGVLKAAGGAGKGFASLVGAVLAIGGAAMGGSDQVADCIKTLMSSQDTATLFIGLLTLTLGLARKAGAVHGAEK